MGLGPEGGEAHRSRCSLKKTKQDVSIPVQEGAGWGWGWGEVSDLEPDAETDSLCQTLASLPTR